jgi:uncharacterized phiE125 gp8 family phage protein
VSDRILPLSQPLGWGSTPSMAPPLPTLVTGPLAEPLTLAQAKNHLRVETSFTEDDGLISDLVAVSREQVERHTRRALYRQKWRLTLDRFPAIIRLPVPPLMAVEAIKYIDANGAEQTLDASGYEVDLPAGYVFPAFGSVWPTTRCQPSAVNVLYWCGYTDGIEDPNAPPEDPKSQPSAGDPLKKIPRVALQAMRLLIGHWYENREEVIAGPGHSQLPMGVAALLSPLRAWSP